MTTFNKDYFKINITVTISVDRSTVQPAPRRDQGRGPQTIAIDSSVIKTVSFRPTVWSRGTLTVEFHTGRIYQYFKVPQGLYDDLIAARSAGAFFNQRIKGQFEHAEIAGDQS